MREIIYKYSLRGVYQTEQNTAFGDESQLKLVVEPHDFSMEIGGESLRKTYFNGCEIVVSCEGEVTFYDNENNCTGGVEKGENCYKEVHLVWEQDYITVQFGHTEEIDYYPNCDGEHDRWGIKWIAERSVKLNMKDNSVEIV